jgi:hypothetical protein
MIERSAHLPDRHMHEQQLLLPMSIPLPLPM